MSITVYQILHVTAGFLLTAFTFMACATASVGKNKALMAITGILSLLMLIGGFGLVAKTGHGFPGWIIVKIGAWLVLSGAAGFAYKHPTKAGTATGSAIMAIVIAILMVYLRPF
jgi:hypothetical protein